jgi:hypothetical protein
MPCAVFVPQPRAAQPSRWWGLSLKAIGLSPAALDPCLSWPVVALSTLSSFRVGRLEPDWRHAVLTRESPERLLNV